MQILVSDVIQRQHTQCLDTGQGFGGYSVVQCDKPYLGNCICNTGKGKCKFCF